MDINLYKNKIKQSRYTGAPIIIKKTPFALPTWEEVLVAFDKSYQEPIHIPDFKPNKTEETMHGSIMVDSFFYYTNLKPYNLSNDYIEPVSTFLTSVYDKNGGASSIKTNLVDFHPISDPIHLDPGDMAYWHLLGNVRWGFNAVAIKNQQVYLNGTDITDLVNKHFTLSNDTNNTEETLKVRNLLSSISEKELQILYPNLIYYPDIILEPGDLAIITDNCWHGYFPMGPRSGMTFRFQ